MKIYHYSKETGEYLREGNARPDPLQPNSFLIPSNATTNEPPTLSTGGNEVQVWDETATGGPSWKLVPDYRGQIFYDKSTKEIVTYEIGDSPDNNVTSTQPPSTDTSFYSWSEGSSNWVIEDIQVYKDSIIEKLKKTANDKILTEYPYHKQININEQQGYVAQDKTDMWDYINNLRSACNDKEAEINSTGVTTKEDVDSIDISLNDTGL